MADQKERIFIETVDNTTRGLRSAQKKLTKFERLLARVQTTLLGFVGINIGFNLARGLIRASDSAIELDAKLRLMTDSTNEFNEAQEGLLEISKESGSSLEANTILFTRMNRAIKANGESMQTTLAVTRLISQGLRISGASAQESASVVRQFSQAMQSGVLRGEEFNAIMENGGRIAQALSDGLGKSLGELRAMSKEGLLTANVVIPALTSQSAILAAENAKLPLTIGRAFENVRTEWTSLLKTFKQGNSFFAEGINGIAQNFELIASAMKSALLISTAYVASMIVMRFHAGSILQQALNWVRVRKEQQAATAAARAQNGTVLQAAANWAKVRKEQKLAAQAAKEYAAFEAQAVASAGGRVSLLRQQHIESTKLKVQQLELNRARATGDAAGLHASVQRQGALVREQALHVSLLKTVIARQQQAVKSATTAKQQAIAQQQLAGAYDLQLAAVKRLNASNVSLLASKKQLTLATGEQLVATKALTVAQGQLTVLQTTGSAAAVSGAAKMTLFGGAMGRAGKAVGLVTGRLRAMGAALLGLPGLALYAAYELISAFGDIQIATIALSEALQKVWAVLDVPIGPGFYDRLDAEFTRIEERSSIAVDKLIEDRERAANGGKSANDRLIDSQKKAAAAVLELEEAYIRLAVPISDATAAGIIAGEKLQVSVSTSFERIAQSADTSGERIQRAFEAALAQLGTEEGVEKVRQSLIKLAEDSRITGEELAGMMDKLNRVVVEGGLEGRLSELGVDFAGNISDGVETAITALKQLSSAGAREFEHLLLEGQTAADLIGEAFTNAIDVSETTSDLKAIGVELQRAFENGSIGPERLNQQLDILSDKLLEVEADSKSMSDGMSSALSDLGVNIGFIRDGISDLGQDAISSFDTLIARIDETGLSAKQVGAAIIQGLVGALEKVRTVRAIDELRAKLKELANEGTITGKQLAEGLAEADEAAAALTDSLSGSAEAFSEFTDSISGSETRKQLDAIGKAATRAWSLGKLSGEAYNRVMESIKAKKDALIDKTEDQIRTERRLADEYRKTGEAGQEGGGGGGGGRPVTRSVTFTPDYAKFDDAEAKQAGIDAAAAMRESFANQIKPIMQLPHTYMKTFVSELEAVNKAGMEAAEAVLAVKAAEERAEVATEKLNASTETLVNNRNTSVEALRQEEKRLVALGNAARKRVDVSQSLDKIRDRLNEIKQATKGATSELLGLQAELATTTGDEEEAARIRHESRVSALREKLVLAQAEGNEEAVTIYTKSLGVLTQIGKEQAKQRGEAKTAAEKQEREDRAAAKLRLKEDKARERAKSTSSAKSRPAIRETSTPTVPAVTKAPELAKQAFRRGIGGNAQIVSPLINTETISKTTPDETIAVKLTVAGETADGVFTKDDATMGMLDELRKSGEVS